MNKIKEKGILIIFAILSIVAIAIAMFFSKSTYSEADYFYLDSGWQVNINDNTYEDVKLSEFVFPVVNKGDTLTMSCDISEDAIVENPVLVMYSIHSVVDVYVDGEHIYNYGDKLHKDEKLLGYGYHFVNIRDYAGKNIEIRYNITENDAFSSIEIPKLCNSVTYFRDFVIKNKVPLAVNMFLIIFGVLIVFISAVFSLVNSRYFKLF